MYVIQIRRVSSKTVISHENKLAHRVGEPLFFFNIFLLNNICSGPFSDHFVPLFMPL